ncbi:PilZ domain-containing protein [Rhizobium halophytocola]|uniref:PilZ domain-containing protein n=1 Tax=Rhizobium halophytocola TaxID=735519 RepID=A0ABS4DYU8_9HYPH|nr:PilZ domain-containing protein [Rhizobium halophytocola]MBP1850856.1 hypothetical protein [Rhizobium halophytocola]
MPLERTRSIRDTIPADQVFEKFRIDRPGRIIFVEHHLSTKKTLRCVIRTISRSGAELDLSPHVTLPNHFFLEILGIRDEIGCTVIRREAERATIAFNMLIDSEYMHHVIRLSFEFSH